LETKVHLYIYTFIDFFVHSLQNANNCLGETKVYI